MRVVWRLPTSRSGGEDDPTPQDKMAVIAQKYAGFFAGHNYSFDQQSSYLIRTDPHERGIHIDKKKWKEPVVIADDCEFCKRTDDEAVVRRITGYQHQIDIEILRGGKGLHYSKWLKACGPSVVEYIDRESDSPEAALLGTMERIGLTQSALNRRAFIEENQWTPRTTARGADRPNGWKYKPTPMVDLPLRLKRKLCIEWNHVYTEYLAERPDVHYDFDTKEFYVEKPDLLSAKCCGGKQAYNKYNGVTILHKEGCAYLPLEQEEGLGYGILAMIIALNGGRLDA